RRAFAPGAAVAAVADRDRAVLVAVALDLPDHRDVLEGRERQRGVAGDRAELVDRVADALARGIRQRVAVAVAGVAIAIAGITVAVAGIAIAGITVTRIAVARIAIPITDGLRRAVVFTLGTIVGARETQQTQARESTNQTHARGISWCLGAD